MRLATQTIGNFTLELTCERCPEQWNVLFLSEKMFGQVAYFRLRHGVFTATCPDAGGQEVYFCRTIGDGGFASEKERSLTIYEALHHVLQWMQYNPNISLKKEDTMK